MNPYPCKIITRRKFFRNVAAGVLGLPLLSCHFSHYRGVPVSDKVIVAHIGLGSMGESHLKWFAGFPDVETAALCDVDQERLAEKFDILKKIHPDTRAKCYTDFRHILDRDDIDVITCATPDHWHALIAIMAFQSQKDVYGEKPLSYSAVEGRAMLNNMRRYDSIFQLGTQIHAGDNYHRVVELIKSGVLGKIHTVRLWKTGGARGLGFPPNETPPVTLNWDMWLGPAPYVEYTPVRCHGSFRNFLDYSGGTFADFWCHIADIAFWALKPQGLTTIEARGETPNDGIADAPRWIDVEYKFKDLNMYWTTNPPDVPGAANRHIGAYFEGTEGTLICDYETRQIRIGNETMEDVPEVPVTIPRSPGHQRNFLDSVKSRIQPESNLEYTRKMTLPMHLGLISFRLKRKLHWDSQTELFLDDGAANYLLWRSYRAPWSIPDVVISAHDDYMRRRLLS